MKKNPNLQPKKLFKNGFTQRNQLSLFTPQLNQSLLQLQEGNKIIRDCASKIIPKFQSIFQQEKEDLIAKETLQQQQTKQYSKEFSVISSMESQENDLQDSLMTYHSQTFEKKNFGILTSTSLQQTEQDNEQDAKNTYNLNQQPLYSTHQQQQQNTQYLYNTEDILDENENGNDNTIKPINEEFTSQSYQEQQQQELEQQQKQFFQENETFQMKQQNSILSRESFSKMIQNQLCNFIDLQETSEELKQYQKRLEEDIMYKKEEYSSSDDEDEEDTDQIYQELQKKRIKKEKQQPKSSTKRSKKTNEVKREFYLKKDDEPQPPKKEWICQVCGKVFVKSHKQIGGHMRQVHPNVNKKKQIREMCQNFKNIKKESVSNISTPETIKISATQIIPQNYRPLSEFSQNQF